MLYEIKDQQDFVNHIKTGTSVVQIHKHGCPYCEKSQPWLEELSKVHKVEFLLAENTKIPDLLEKFNLKSYPTFLVIENGVIKDTFSGDTQEEKVKDFVNKNL